MTFRRGAEVRAGAVVDIHVIDLVQAAKALGVGALPASLRLILEGGAPALGRAAKTVRRAQGRLGQSARGGQRRPAWAIPLQEAELAPPIPDPEKIICIGQNYRDHCQEHGVEPPKTPIFFTKFASTLTGPASPILLPPENLSRQVDFEVELAFVIGRGGKRISRQTALGHVAGYMVLNDVSARDLQFADRQWTRGKSLDSFAPCGPWLTTADEAPDPHRLRLWLKLNGRTMQESTTANLIFDIPYLIEYISRGLTFRPGDIVSTGTPAGVGIFRKPPVSLKPGDLVEAGVEGLGELRNPCRRDRR